MTPDEFCVLATKLRELGALKVKAGELEVVFSLAVPRATPVQVETPAKPPRKKPLKPEEALLQQFREELGEA